MSATTGVVLKYTKPWLGELIVIKQEITNVRDSYNMGDVATYVNLLANLQKYENDVESLRRNYHNADKACDSLLVTVDDLREKMVSELNSTRGY